MHKKRIAISATILVSSFIIILLCQIHNMKNEYYEFEFNHNTSNWALNNTGVCDSFSKDAWGTDTRKCVSGIDMDLVFDSKFLAYRKCKVAIIDSKVARNVNTNALYHNEYEIINNGKDDDNNGYVDDYYGWNFCNNTSDIFSLDKETHCSDVINLINDISNGFALMPLVILKDNDSGSVENLVEAIKYAEDNDVNICNLSLTTNEYSPVLKEVMANSKMLFVVSAGNEGREVKNKDIVFPISYNLDNVISVADLRCDGKLSKISNYGENTIDIAAPGTDIKGNNMDYCVSGTSFAAANVTGIAASLFCISPRKMSALQLKEALLISSQELGIEVKTRGCVDFGKAINIINARRIK